MKTETTTNDITIPSQPATVPFKRLTLAVGTYTATIESVERFAELSQKGEQIDKLRVVFNTEEGKTTYVQNIHVPSCRAYVIARFNEAVGGISKISDLAGAIGKKVTLVTAVDTFGPKPKVKIKYVNRYNPFAGMKLSLSDFDDEEVVQPETIVFG